MAASLGKALNVMQAGSTSSLCCATGCSTPPTTWAHHRSRPFRSRRNLARCGSTSRNAASTSEASLIWPVRCRAKPANTVAGLVPCGFPGAISIPPVMSTADPRASPLGAMCVSGMRSDRLTVSFLIWTSSPSGALTPAGGVFYVKFRLQLCHLHLQGSDLSELALNH